MAISVVPDPAYLTTMADGTIKQINPSTGTRVWTVPGRGKRPFAQNAPDPHPLSDTDWTHGCVFCSARYMETPPEKVRMVRTPTGWQTIEHVPAQDLFATLAEFRVVPNLYEIVSYDYWHQNYGYDLSPELAARKQAYLSTTPGKRHVIAVQAAKMRQFGKTTDEISCMDEAYLLGQADAFFGGGHDVVIARRHWVDDASTTAELASSGTLTPDEHEQYIRLTLYSMERLYETNRYVRYVAAFQNWLKPAGASFDHLHKQLVAIDEHGVNADEVVLRIRDNPNFFNESGVNYANYHNLLVAENEHAVAFAGFGHRYPTVEVFSKSAQTNPWEHSWAEVRAMSDIIQAVHAATGADVPCNEEWHHTPPDVDAPSPWRINLKWRISTVAGFEGDTKIYINTLSPKQVRDMITGRLVELRAAGRIADIRIGDECSGAPNPLKYNPALW